MWIPVVIKNPGLFWFYMNYTETKKKKNLIFKMKTRRVEKLFNGLFAGNKPCGVLSTQVVYVKISYLKKNQIQAQKN